MRRLLVVCTPLLFILMLAFWRALGPAPRPLEAPTGEFSSARAMRSLEWLLDEEVPHPTGTKENALVRSGIVTQFRSLGYETKIQRRFVCDRTPTCGNVENIIAIHPSGGPGKAAALVAHYDSVPAGPGASDDLMGVAALLEVARAVKEERFRNRVVFLVTDGEEAGLLGAEAFVADPLLSKDVEVFVNVENRGTFGASNMFETSRGNRWLVRHLAEALPRPQATSFFPAVYDRLPNDTDLSVFKRQGKSGLNFAAIRGVNWYHTPLDDLAHASPRTLQHHGENLLAMLRALGAADLDAKGKGDAVFFDVLGFTVVWWPAGWTPWIAALSLTLLVIAVRHEVPREMTFGVLAVFGTVVLAAAGGAALSWLASLRNGGANWVASPGTLIASMWLAGVAAALFSSALFRRRAEPKTMIYGAAIVFHVIAFVLSLTVPGASFIFLLPAIAATLAALLRLGETATAAVATSCAAVVFFPIAVVLYEALGRQMIVVAAVLIALMATLAAPLFAKHEIAAAAALVAVFCAAAAALQAPFDQARPQLVSLAWVDDPGAKSPQWTTTAVTPALARVAAFTPTDPSLLPGARRSWSTPGAGISVPRVQMAGQRNGDRVTIRVRSGRRARRVGLLIRGEITGLTVGGIVPPTKQARYRSRLPAGWSRVVVTGWDSTAIEFRSARPVEVIAWDVTWGLPGGEKGVALLKARDASPAVPVHDGDVTITRARATL